MQRGGPGAEWSEPAAPPGPAQPGPAPRADMGLACRLSALGLLLSALLVCTRSQDRESVFAIVGEDFTFSPKVNGTIREITWMKNKDKAAEWEHDTKSPVYYYSLAERGVLETSSGNLTIKKLNIGDTAEYEAQVLPVGVDQLQYTKFVLAVLAPPPPSALNCSVTNGQIRISCEIQFSKDVRYSWYRDDRKIDANSPVLELKENVNPSEKVLCVREVSKTKINNSISLSTCIPESPESLSRGRAGLIAFFVLLLLLLLFVGALVVLWKRGLFANIHRRISRKHAGYTPADPECKNPVDFEVAGHQSGEAAKLEEIQQDVPVSLQDSNESQAEKGSHKKEGNLFHTWTKKIRGNIDRVRSGRTHKTGYTPADPECKNPVDFEVAGHQSDEEKSSKETKSMNQSDLPSSQEKTEEEKKSKETESTSQADNSSNQEKTGEAAKLEEIQQDVPVSLQDSNESQAEKGSHKKEGNLFHTWTKKIRGNIDRVRSGRTHKTDEEKSSKETKSMNQSDLPSSQEKTEEEKKSKETESTSQADNSSNQEKTGEAAKSEEKKQGVRMSLQDSNESQAEEGEAAKSEEIQQGVRTSLQDSNESQAEKEEEKNSEETLSTSQADNSSNEENPDYENISKETQKPEEEKNSSLNQ
ncbi:lymphocyte function-associated antigen 3 isoform X1 [Malaclemys terrapin pileata]|uniref:lymphocyte function-associated antigen 3 isoform X1 n=1 Tax=Malaclemys terrapin pileata TaxID=2991368 RepID=UPI0023A85A6A|nr:lymphocyte function-associated antigen 3 isoform X1 [Malaclemys terrapin pileata]